MIKSRILKKIISLFLLSAILLTTAIGTASATDDELDPDVYDLDAIESGLTDRQTDMQLSENHEPNAIIIKFHPLSMFPGREHQYNQAVDQVLRWGFRYEPINVLDDTYFVFNDEFEKNPNAVMNRFKNNRFIEYVEPNFIGSFERVPNDPQYVVFGNVYARIINAEAGWAIITDSSIPIAVIDTGMSGNADLPSPLRSYNVLNRNTDVTDRVNHGTGVAGTIGAIGNNNLSVSGVVWNASLIPVKISDTATVTVANVANGIIWATDNGARIINLSLSFTSDSTTLKNAVDYAYNRGAILVAATGNGANATVNFPARYTNVLGVGGTSNGTTRSTNTNHGTGLDVLANWNWVTTNNAGGVVAGGGTSIATPQVSGLAALVWELAPNLTNMQVMDLIRNNTNRGNGVRDNQTGFGTIDMGKTLAAAQALGSPSVPQPEPVNTTPPVLTLLGNTTITLTEGNTYIEPGFTAIDNTGADITNTVTVTGDVHTAFAGSYTLTYKAIDSIGNMTTVTRTIVVNPAPVVTPERTPPFISPIGSNPIILHLGGSSYIEQGAVATCNVDDDISYLITTSGNVDTSRAGTYRVTYTVTNSAGLTSNVTRDVRVLSPTERRMPRTPHSFTVNGKVNASTTNTITAEADGIMTLTVSVANKTSGRVVITNGAGTQVFNQTFSGNAARDIQLTAGVYTVVGTITEGNGNTNFTMGILMPEVIFMNFAEAEVPLADFKAIGSGGVDLTFTIVAAGVGLFYIAGLIVSRKYKITITKR